MKTLFKFLEIVARWFAIGYLFGFVAAFMEDLKNEILFSWKRR